MYAHAKKNMKKTFLLLTTMMMVVLTSCQETLEERCAREAKEFTEKNCPHPCAQEYLVDGNFDRVFDDKDKAPRYPHFNVAILISRLAYSWGNLLPSLMKDYGYLIIGEKSGGSSCSIQKHTSYIVL